MTDTANRRALLAIAVASLLLAVAILSVRNLYEDEWTQLATIHMPMRELWHWSNTRDIHPPGAYALDRLVWQAVPNARALGFVHLLAWTAGLAAFVFAARRLPATGWGRVGFASIAFLHPQVLMWNTSLRWYPVWWGVALAMVAAGLLPRRREDVPGWGTTLALGLAAGLLIYLDYLALIFLPCFALAWVVRHGWGRASLARLGASAGLSALVAAPQLVQLSHRALAEGRGHMLSPLPTAARMAHALALGGAILPWHWVAPLVVLGLMIPAAWAFIVALPAWLRGTAAPDPVWRRELSAVLVLVALLIGLGVVTGVASHIYTFLGLVPLVVLGLALGAERIRARAWRVLAVLIASAWVGVGAWHLLARTGTIKRQVNDHPEEIIARLEQLAGGDSALIVTSDMVLTFEINARRARHATPLVTASIWDDRVHGFGPGLPVDPLRYRMVFDVEHPEGENNEAEAIARAALEQTRMLIADPQRADLGVDPDFALKNRFSGARLAGARLAVWYGRPLPGDWMLVDRTLERAAERSVIATGNASGDD